MRLFGPVPRLRLQSRALERNSAVDSRANYRRCPTGFSTVP
jgi:hypothetical protein